MAALHFSPQFPRAPSWASERDRAALRALLNVTELSECLPDKTVHLRIATQHWLWLASLLPIAPNTLLRLILANASDFANVKALDSVSVKIPKLRQVEIPRSLLPAGQENHSKYVTNILTRVAYVEALDIVKLAKACLVKANQ